VKIAQNQNFQLLQSKKDIPNLVVSWFTAVKQKSKILVILKENPPPEPLTL
jgi:hypothetical protein